MRIMSRGVDRTPANSRRQHEVDAVQARAAGAPGQHQRRPFADPAEADQVARIDRHAEMQDFAAGPHDPRRPDIAPVHHGRGADHQQQIGPLADQAVQRPADRFLVMRATDAAAAGSRSGR